MKSVLLCLFFVLLNPLCIQGGVLLHYPNLAVEIPNDFTGVYIQFNDVSSPSDVTITTGSTPATWDFNFFFGGAGVGSSNTLQAATSTGSLNDPVLRLDIGDQVDGLNFPSSYSGSTGHIVSSGATADQWSNGDTGFIGFRKDFDGPGDGSTDYNYGWVEVQLNNDGNAGSILGWGWDDNDSATGVTVVPEASAPSITALLLATGVILHRRRRSQRLLEA
ncbi:MAG: hypothetical protein AAGA58_11105 [Verrucomicrobiota bacterium]